MWLCVLAGVEGQRAKSLLSVLLSGFANDLRSTTEWARRLAFVFFFMMLSSGPKYQVPVSVYESIVHNRALIKLCVYYECIASPWDGVDGWFHLTTT